MEDKSLMSRREMTDCDWSYTIQGALLTSFVIAKTKQDEIQHWLGKNGGQQGMIVQHGPSLFAGPWPKTLRKRKRMWLNPYDACF